MRIQQHEAADLIIYYHRTYAPMHVVCTIIRGTVRKFCMSHGTRPTTVLRICLHD